MRTNDWVGKRQAARQPVNMRGEMRFLDGSPPKECLITDISATGCAIDLFSEFDVPEDFDLFIPSRSETKICKIRRAAGVKLGVAFLKSRLDDPLVMQTLLERVLRLERGYAELKGAPISAAGATSDRRESSEPRRAEDRELAIAGPSIDQRIQSLASGLAELRGAIRALESAMLMTRRGGTTVTAGLPPPDARLPVNVVGLVAEERTLKGCCPSPVPRRRPICRPGSRSSRATLARSRTKWRRWPRRCAARRASGSLP